MRNYLDTYETVSVDTERERERSVRHFTTLALAQGIYFAITGIWPLVSRPTFEAITGPKVDFWLVRTVGALVTVIGGVLILAGRRKNPAPEIVTLGAGSAGALALIDGYYSLRGRISKVYLADALLEVVFLVLWGRHTQALRNGSDQANDQHHDEEGAAIFQSSQ
jgi:hypothetical protein